MTVTLLPPVPLARHVIVYEPRPSITAACINHVHVISAGQFVYTPGGVWEAKSHLCSRMPREIITIQLGQCGNQSELLSIPW